MTPDDEFFKSVASIKSAIAENAAIIMRLAEPYGPEHADEFRQSIVLAVLNAMVPSIPRTERGLWLVAAIDRYTKPADGEQQGQGRAN